VTRSRALKSGAPPARRPSVSNGRPFAEQTSALRWAAIAGGGAFIIVAIPYLMGDLWFDECITIGDQIERSFATCFSYDAANNHMLYSAMLWLWVHATQRSTEVVMRLPGLLMALATLALLYRSGRRLFNLRIIGLLMLMVLAFSPVYLGYFYQRRGYGLSILLAVLATIGALHIVRGELRIGIGMFALGAIPLPAVIPSNLMVNFCLLLFLVLFFQQEQRLQSNLRLLATLTLIALAGLLIYLPMAHQVLTVLGRTTGWESGTMASGHWALAAAAHGGLFAIGMGVASRMPAAPRPASVDDAATLKVFASLKLLLIVCLVVPAIVLIVRAPFPRVCLPLLGPLTFAALAGLRPHAMLSNRVVIVLIVLIMGNYLIWTRTATALEQESRAAGVFRQNLLQQYYTQSRDVSTAAATLLQSGRIGADARVLIDWHYYLSFEAYWARNGGAREQVEALGEGRTKPPGHTDSPTFAIGYSEQVLTEQLHSALGTRVQLQALPSRSGMKLFEVR
jgi:hypothetical protein